MADGLALNTTVAGQAAGSGEISLAAEAQLEQSSPRGGGDGATLTVCAFNALHPLKCHYRANGKADEVQIRAAIAALPPRGGSIVLSEGTFRLGGTIDMVDNLSIRGQGESTVLRLAENAPGTVRMLQAKAIGPGDNLLISDLVIDGNSEHQRESGHKAISYIGHNRLTVQRVHVRGFQDAGVYLSGVSNSLIADSTLEDCSSDLGCIYMESSSAYNTVVRNTVLFSTVTGTGIRLLSSSHNVLSGNTIKMTAPGAGTGIYMEGNATGNVLSANVIEGSIYGIYSNVAANSWSSGNLVLNNRVRDVRYGGIYLNRSGRSQVSNNIVEISGEHGIQLYLSDDNLVSGNIVTGNSQRAHNTYSGINIEGASRNLITNNLIRRGSAAPQPRHGIQVYDGASNSNLIMGNDLESSGVTALLSNNGTGTIVRGNRGYRTENAGTATIPSGSTWASVSHGLAITPSAANCTLTPTNNLGAASEFWVDAFGAATFRINVNADPGAGGASFAWACQTY